MQNYTKDCSLGAPFINKGGPKKMLEVHGPECHGGIFMKPHRARLGDKILSDLVNC